MKLTCQRKDLSRALSLASRAVASSPVQPILGCIALDARGGELAVQGNNLETAITVSINATVSDQGMAVLPARTITELVGNLTGDVVELVEDKQAVSVSCGRNRSKVKGQPVDHWPPVPEDVDDDEELVINGLALKAALGQVAHAVARNDTRPVLTGVLMHHDGQNVKFAAADGYRLAVSMLAVPEEKPFKGIIPLRAINELMRLLGDDDVRLSFEEGKFFRASGADWHLVSRLIDGSFPNYRQIIPTRHTVSATVNRLELLRVLRATRVLADSGKEFKHRTRFTIGCSQMTISTQNAEIGEASETINAAVEGDEMEFSVSGPFIEDAVGAIPTEQVAIETQSPSLPILVLPVGSDQTLQVVMPMYLGSR